LIQNNNDFSSSDILENLLVTFNPSRPLIFPGEQVAYYRGLLDKISTEDDALKKYQLYKELGTSLLRKGFLVPIAYKNLIVFHRKSLDFSEWSTLFPDILFWKIKKYENEISH